MFDLGNHDILRTTIYSPLSGTFDNYGSSLKSIFYLPTQYKPVFHIDLGGTRFLGLVLNC